MSRRVAKAAADAEADDDDAAAANAVVPKYLPLPLSLVCDSACLVV